jgi:hypothetical protein
MCVIQHCFICRPLYYAGIESVGLWQLWHGQPDALTTRLDFIHKEKVEIIFFTNIDEVNGFFPTFIFVR